MRMFHLIWQSSFSETACIGQSPLVVHSSNALVSEISIGCPLIMIENSLLNKNKFSKKTLFLLKGEKNLKAGNWMFSLRSLGYNRKQNFLDYFGLFSDISAEFHFVNQDHFQTKKWHSECHWLIFQLQNVIDLFKKLHTPNCLETNRLFFDNQSHSISTQFNKKAQNRNTFNYKVQTKHSQFEFYPKSQTFCQKMELSFITHCSDFFVTYTDRNKKPSLGNKKTIIQLSLSKMTCLLTFNLFILLTKFGKPCSIPNLTPYLPFVNWKERKFQRFSQCHLETSTCQVSFQLEVVAIFYIP